MSLSCFIYSSPSRRPRSFSFHRHLPSSLTYPQAKPLILVVQGSAWGEGFTPFTTHQTMCHVTITRVVIVPLYLLYDLYFIVPLLLSFHFLRSPLTSTPTFSFVVTPCGSPFYLPLSLILRCQGYLSSTSFKTSP